MPQSQPPPRTPHDDLETVIGELERSESDRPSTEITIVTEPRGREKDSLIAKLPSSKFAQVVIGLVALAAIVKTIWEILKL